MLAAILFVSSPIAPRIGPRLQADSSPVSNIGRCAVANDTRQRGLTEGVRASATTSSAMIEPTPPKARNGFDSPLHGAGLTTWRARSVASASASAAELSRPTSFREAKNTRPQSKYQVQARSERLACTGHCSAKDAHRRCRRSCDTLKFVDGSCTRHRTVTCSSWFAYCE